MRPFWETRRHGESVAVFDFALTFSLWHRPLWKHTDNESGKVSDERYEKMSSRLESEQAELTQTLAVLENEIATQNEQVNGIDRFLVTLKRNTEIEELTPAIVHELIDKIIIYEPEQARGNRRQNVGIIYNNIGMIGSFPGRTLNTGLICTDPHEIRASVGWYKVSCDLCAAFFYSGNKKIVENVISYSYQTGGGNTTNLY